MTAGLNLFIISLSARLKCAIKSFHVIGTNVLALVYFHVDIYSRAGLRGRELTSMVGKSMLQGGGTFGVFMSVGTAIRC